MAKEQENNLTVIMQVMTQAGEAKNDAMHAIQAAKANDFRQALSYLDQANIELNKAHTTQSKLLTQIANGQHTKLDLYLIHAEDHLMGAITFIDLAKEFVDLYQKLANNY
ncbi:PTS lactose/cellobiose transporter subunit IIA [Lactobacillus sp. PV034]|uniref:PTS lactose/cellobiose transporter subunit IIA n=1 Tax=Lactobacillus sp. PV034 TaxID=2594495 RepID=UPI002240B365|nr:PTS lactose/cellobiose transporter subunit IIA [Lactobacillus sp. PV034]QNQ80980.1 PTS lactose/cellobiose transporter subunit IIA [Lactobacillus sp. PV034]